MGEENPGDGLSLSSATFSSSGSSSSSSVETTTKNYSAGSQWSLATTNRSETKVDGFTSSSHGSKAGGQWTLDSYTLDSQASAAFTLTEVGEGTSGHGIPGMGMPMFNISWTTNDSNSSLQTHHEEGTFASGAYNLSEYQLDSVERVIQDRYYERRSGEALVYATDHFFDQTVTTHKTGAGRVGDVMGSYDRETVTTSLYGTFMGYWEWNPGSGQPQTITTNDSGSFYLVAEMLAGAATTYHASSVTLDQDEVSFTKLHVGYAGVNEALGDLTVQQMADYLASRTLWDKLVEEWGDPSKRWKAVGAFFAGVADQVTFGLSTRLVGLIAGADTLAGLQQSAFWQAGSYVGMGVTLAVAFLPCGGALTALRIGISAVQVAGASANAMESFSQGNILSGLLDVVDGIGAALGLRACFTGEMEVLTRRGAVRWDQLAVSDEVLSRDEFHADGPTSYKRVEELLRSHSPICNLHLTDGQVHRTTSEHPFWVEGKGWVDAQELKAGDRLVTLDGSIACVEEVYFTREVEPVYNARIAEYHTYFVRSPGGTWVWAHNRCTPLQQLGQTAKGARDSLRSALKATSGWIAHHIVPWSLRSHPLVQLAARGGFGINIAVNGVLLKAAVHAGRHGRYTEHITAILDRLLIRSGGDPTRAAKLLSDLTSRIQEGLPRLDRLLR